MELYIVEKTIKFSQVKRQEMVSNNKSHAI